jgi:hypothetical protein
MENFIQELIPIFKRHIKIKQTKVKCIDNFCRFYIIFIEQNKNPKENKDKYLQLKKLGLHYIRSNQDLIYSEINK